MDQLPEPLTPNDCDLRDFAFMPLDVVRLRDSDMAATETPEACWAAVLLWAASWHQVPAASLPDDDRVLSNLSGYGRVVKEWQRVKEGALRGWVKCSDGRLYHPVVAEKACESWIGKLHQRHRTELARIKKHNDRHETKLPIPDFETWIEDRRPRGQIQLSPGTNPIVPGDKSQCPSGQHQFVPVINGGCPLSVPGETASKGKGKGKGEGYVLIPGAKAPSSAAKLPTCPYDAIVSQYHEILPELPGVRVMDKDREKAILEFWKWVLTTNRPDGTPRASTSDEAIAWTRDYLSRARDNDFIMGRGPKSPEHANWRCTIEYLLSTRGMKKVIEETKEAA
jgi:hypothetical protein